MKLTKLAAGAASAIAVFMAPCAYAAQTFVLSFNNGTSELAGTITTNGVIGGVTASDILGWSFSLTGVPGSSLSSTDAGASYQCIGTSGCFTATPSTLTFDFLSGTPNDPYAVFQSGSLGVRFLNQDSRVTHINGGAGAGLLIAEFIPPSDVVGVSDNAAVPEPASWALMISGFGLAGAALRQSRRRTRLPV